ncbi:hypothetical protein BT96DRAFT_843835, partial [Gymnopus androsaceus JB14]
MQITLQQWLRKFPGLAPKDIKSLTDPVDHQNVPKVVKLLRHVQMVPKFVPHCSDMNPAKATLDLIGQLWSYLINAFITPSYSLTKQLESLGIYSHFAIELYIRHGPSLMSPQLYYNSQSLVKSCYFYAECQKELDPNENVYFYHNGSNQGKRKFCSVRTATHDTNLDILGLADSLSEDSDMDRIIEENLDLNQEHHRTSWTNSPNIDHVNPKFFIGNLRAAKGDSLYAWDSSWQKAELL